MAIDETTTELIRNILEDIATTASALKSSLHNTESDYDRNHAHAILATKIGWQADLAIEKMVGKVTVVGGAEDWFMSPSYHKINQKMMGVGHD